MPGEISPKGVEASQEAAQFDEAFFAENFGLTADEALQTVSFGEQGSAPFWQVLMDGRCPVGGWVKTAFTEGGREAVEGKLALFNQMDPEFNVALGEDAEIKVNFERELASMLEETNRNIPEVNTDETDKTRDLEKPLERPTTEVSVLVGEIVQDQERASQTIPKKKVDLTPTETVASIENIIKKPEHQTETLKAKAKPKPTPTPTHAPEITLVKSVEPKPVPPTTKLEPKHNRPVTNPTLVVEQKPNLTFVQTKPETPTVIALMPTETVHTTIRDVVLPELPDIEIQEPAESSVYIDRESLADDSDIFTNPEATFELPDFEQLETALPFIEFQQPEQSAVEDEYSDTQEIPSVVDQLYLHFETLEPELALEAGEILSTIMEKIQELESQEMGVYRDALEQELETICERMLICMDIEPTPVLVKNLLLVLKIEHQEQLGLDAQIAYDEGTHERKNAVFQSAYRLPLEISHTLFHSLGRHTLMLAS